MLGLDEVDPLPVPNSPAIMQQMPSVKIPLVHFECIFFGLLGPKFWLNLQVAMAPSMARVLPGGRNSAMAN